MKKYLIGLIAVAVAVGIWQQDAITAWWETRDMTEEEKQEYREEQEENEELGDELKELEDELEDEEASGSDSLDDLEVEE